MMRKGSIFWGIFFLTLGLLILGRQLNIIDFDISFVPDLWPIIIIMLGISLFKIPDYIRNSLYGFSGFLLAIFISSVFDSNERYWKNFHLHWEKDCSGRVESAYFIESVPDGHYQSADLNFTAGAGDFDISGISSDLITLDGYGKLEMNGIDERNAFISYKANNLYVFDGDDYERESRIKLNPETVWNIHANIGASELTADLSDYHIRNFSLTASTSGIELKFGEKSDSIDIDIDARACGLKLSVPGNAGCELKVDNVLSGMEYRDFVNTGDNTYRTVNYDSSKVKFKVNIKSGISGIEIIRY